MAAQLSELKQLRISLEETRREREQLLNALAAEREKAALELKERETLSVEQKRKYEQSAWRPLKRNFANAWPRPKRKPPAGLISCKRAPWSWKKH